MKVNLLDRVERIVQNIAHPHAISDEERNDLRLCKHCGGLRKEHGIYGTHKHVPDMDKPLDGYLIATAFCDGFEPNA